MEDKNLTDEQKAELCKQEDLKMWKMIAMTAEKVDSSEGEFDKAVEYYNAYVNYDKIQGYQKQIKEIEDNKELSDVEKRDRIDRLYSDMAEAGIDMGGSLEIINSTEFKNYKENYDDVQKQYDAIEKANKKIEDANKKIDEINASTKYSDAEKAELIAKQKEEIDKQKSKITRVSRVENIRRTIGLQKPVWLIKKKQGIMTDYGIKKYAYCTKNACAFS